VSCFKKNTSALNTTKTLKQNKKVKLSLS